MVRLGIPTPLGWGGCQRSILRHKDSPIQTYLAIPTQIYRTFFQHQIVQNLIQDEQIRLLIFNPATETIEQWKD